MTGEALSLGTVDSRPYRWPYHGRLAPERTALLLFEGDLGIAASSGLRQKWRGLVAALRSAGCTAIVSSPASHAPASGLGGDLSIPRPHYSGFAGADLDAALRGRGLTDLVIAGAPFELGADCTMRAANDLGYECLALVDCCEGVTAETLAGAMRSIQMSGGIFGAVARSTDLRKALRTSIKGA